MAKLLFHDCICVDCGREWSQGVPPKRCPSCRSENTRLIRTQEDNLPPRV